MKSYVNKIMLLCAFCMVSFALSSESQDSSDQRSKYAKAKIHNTADANAKDYANAKLTDYVNIKLRDADIKDVPINQINNDFSTNFNSVDTDFYIKKKINDYGNLKLNPIQSSSMRSCTDTDNGAGDSYGDTCASWYDAYPSSCGGYDDDDFVAGDMCCACGGGETGSSDDGGDDGSADDGGGDDGSADGGGDGGGECSDTDNGAADSYGDTCASWYDAYPSSCGGYDDDDFVAGDMCCACGGGSTGSSDDGGDDGSADDGGDDGSADDGGDGGEECVNDDSVGDSYGDTCSSWYDAYPSSCGGYDTEDFVAAELCCACGGGSTGSGDDGGDDGSADDGGDGGGVCVNDDSTSDSYGDTCSSWYDAYPSSCGGYDDDDFVAAEQCCACGGGDTGGLFTPGSNDITASYVKHKINAAPTVSHVKAKLYNMMIPVEMAEAKTANVSEIPMAKDGKNDGLGQFGNLRAGWVLVGYYYYYGDSGASAFTITGLNYGEESRTYAVTSVNSTGEESELSNEASGTTPVLSAPTDLTAVEGDSYVNLSWAYDGYAAPEYPGCNGTLIWINDGYCDSGNNNPECGWDGGDCCASSCVDNDETEATYGCDSCSDEGTGSGCGNQSDADGDGLWDSCFDPDNGGEGIPTCNDDYQFAVLATECSTSTFSNAYTITWNSGCSGMTVFLDGEQYFSTNSYLPPVISSGFGPNEDHLFELYADGVVVASETESTSDEDCAGLNPYPDCAGNLSWIADGYCDDSNNNEACGYDAGDCCPNDCVDEQYSCDTFGGTCDDCIDPDSADNAEGGECDDGATADDGGDGGGECVNDDSTGDSYGDTCSSWYDAYPSSCGGYDDDDFVAADQCCACGGGSTDSGDDGGDDGSADDGGDGGEECVNDDSVGDSYGDTCSSWYDAYPSSCGGYDTEDFVAAELCCACGGGSTGSGDDGGDDGSAGDGGDGGEECVNDDSTSDSYGDTCSSWYDAYPSSCGGYDDDDFVAAEQCCACQDGTLRNSGKVSLYGTHKFINEKTLHSVDNNQPEKSDGFIVTDRDYKLSQSSSNSYRLAEGFKVYSDSGTGEWQFVADVFGTDYQVASAGIGCYAVSAFDSSPSYESELSDSACIEEATCPLAGDSNSDGIVNVSDIVLLVNAILNGGGSTDGVECGDTDGGGIINVSDIVSIVNIILGGRIASYDDATQAAIIISDNTLQVEANGFIQGVQLTLSHDSDFSINLVDAYVSEYKTSDNMTTLVVVSDGSSSLNEIASFSGTCKVENVHIANSTSDVTVEETIELVDFKVDVAGPNPFNPSTQLNIVVPEAGFVSVRVYNVLGQEVANLVDGYMEASTSGYLVNWNAGSLASGVYFVKAATAGQISTQKLMLLK